jgi:Partial alpha/beta-hydrolase lipase region
VQTHRIETEDGYQIKCHRILPKIQKERKGPVLLVHGLFGTAADFVLGGPNVALGKTIGNAAMSHDMFLSRIQTIKRGIRCLVS